MDRLRKSNLLLLFLFALQHWRVSGIEGVQSKIHQQSDALKTQLTAHLYKSAPSKRTHGRMVFLRGGHQNEGNGEDEDTPGSECDEVEYDCDNSKIWREEDHEKIPSQNCVEPFKMSPTIQLYTTFGAMMLCRRLDLLNPWIVRTIRFAFILQTIIQQVFVLYVRILASRQNDQTLVKMTNPISGILQSHLESQDETNAIVKNIASSFLQSEITVAEYDIQQATNMQGGVLLNIVFMWYLHFKLHRVQPLLVQIVMGFFQLVYSPLFQAYALRRKLQRPFVPNPSQGIRDILSSSNTTEKS